MTRRWTAYLEVEHLDGKGARVGGGFDIHVDIGRLLVVRPIRLRLLRQVAECGVGLHEVEAVDDKARGLAVEWEDEWRWLVIRGRELTLHHQV